MRIPKIEGKIVILRDGPHRGHVMYIYENKWDKEKKQMRNRKTMIGQTIEDFPGVMQPNENYDRFFDRETGEPRETAEEARAEENEREMTERQEMIRDVLENEGILGRDSERIRGAIRGTEEAENETEGNLSATEIVGTPHCGDSSFSVELSSDETSATGGCQS